MYTEEQLMQAITPASSAPFTALSLVGSTGVYSIYNVMSRIKIKRCMVKVSTLIATSSANAQVGFYQRPTPGSTSGEVLLATVIVPTGTAVGKVVYKDLESTSLLVGQDIVVKLVVAGTDASSAAGAGFVGFGAELDPEDPRSEANMILSA